ncbi:hypothetical protein VTK73DRAFT_2013 [Phialemonium thermophilum]|uniref:PUM-HD domain-containing protein n=1 Tax=Phialemonium thermophilum TaxID=223376 RepID=A0ABR3X6M4_9PEZI
MDDFFRSQQSPQGDAQLGSAFVVSPPRNGPLLPRRFTTDSSRVPTLSSIITQRGTDPQDFAATAALHKVQLLEKKRLEYERLREQKRRFEAEMHKLDAQQRQEERELALMQEDLGRFGGNGLLAGHQSEPTTPPEYRETSSGFPTLFSRPNRYSTSSLTSPPGLFNRPARSGSQLTSPPASIGQTRLAFDDQLPSRSVPGTRRNSDEDEKEEAVRQDPTSHRSTNALNRYSMPVTRSRPYFPDLSVDNTLDGNNTTGFLFGDEDLNLGDMKKFPQATTNTENFPTLIRREGFPNMLSTPSTALDLAQAQNLGNEQSSSAGGWGTVNNHHHRQSISALSSTQINNNSSSVGSGSGQSSEVPVIGSRPSSIRHSLDLKYFQDNTSITSDAASTIVPTSGNLSMAPPKLQQSFSANDVPTMKSTNGTVSLGNNVNNHAQQHFHNHNASIGRIPAGAVPNRHSRELSSENNPASMTRESSNYPSIGSTLQANATPFGPSVTQSQPNIPSTGATTAAPTGASSAAGLPYQYYNPSAYNNTSTSNASYGVPMLAMTMQGLSLNGANPAIYPPHGYTTGYNPLYNQVGPRGSQDSQARVIQNRRQLDSEAMSRYTNLPLESVGGTIYDLCKDQHGCRYLQKQLENRIPEQIHMIWLETNQHVVELMTDPFGNYLCQKLLEYCNDEERTVLIQNAAQDMVRIALNQHGTRALQKMIEFVSSPTQVEIIVNALRFRVVELIQDLNGNHVIQKCLNKLSSSDAQFIFDAVGTNCVDVGTHRHGCCVLQRCIDHASGDQKVWLIQQITDNAVALVQDPFGNYVVQYIIDLNEPTFTEPLVGMFRGRISALSRHKFSSNVVEKCLRCAQDPSRDLIVEELLAPGEIDRLLRDSFANYVIQTALEYATQYMKHRLVEAIRPSLPSIRSTPYGRRIQAKVQAYDNRSGTTTSGQATPSDATQGQIPLRPAHSRAMSSNTSILTQGGYTNGINGTANQGAGSGYPSSNGLTVPPPQPQRGHQYQPPFTRNGSTGEGGDPQWL